MRFILLTLFIAVVGSINAQTYYYERVKIVSNGKQRTCCDDAHYITFNGNRCYDSDVNGYALNPNHSFKYNRTENGTQYYSGNCIFGQDCDFYITSSKDRINLQRGNEIYVYVRTTPSASRAAKRAVSENKNNIIVVPENHHHDEPSKSTSPDEYRRYPGPRKCTYCNGTGKGTEIIESAPSYVAYEERYCAKCGRVTYPHYHRIPMCRACNGKGFTDW